MLLTKRNFARLIFTKSHHLKSWCTYFPLTWVKLVYLLSPHVGQAGVPTFPSRGSRSMENTGRDSFTLLSDI